MGSQLKNSFILHVSAQIIFNILKNTIEVNFKKRRKCLASYFFFKSPEAKCKYFILGLISVDMLLLTAFLVLSFFLGRVCTSLHRILAFFLKTPSVSSPCLICTCIMHHFSGAPRGAFQQPVYNKCKVPWLRVLARPLQAVHNGFLSETLSCALS